MKRFHIFFVLALLLFPNFNSKAQDYKSQRAQMMVFNVGFNGLIGGIGAGINKKDNESFGQAFKKGLLGGAIGGLVSHTGLTLTHQIRSRQSIALAWPARLTNSLGASIIQNATENKRLLERLHFNLFISRLEYFPYSKKFTARLFTSSIYGIVVTGKNAHLNVEKSLKSGVLYFESSDDFSTSIGTGRATGQVSSVGMRTDLTKADHFNVFSHEVAHILQYDRKIGGNAFLLKFNKKLKTDYKIYNTLSKYIYFDFNGPIFYFAYKAQGTIHNCNFFEQEAEHYSGKTYYGCN
ncbi:MAG: hypothetical protein RIM99_16160 [Cyclobacteriaceae bacterium]